MMPAQSNVDAGVWNVPGHATVIEYSRQTLSEILTQVIDAYDTYLGGGYEVGGVLFGRREGNLVRVLASRPLPIEPPRPSFVLSAGDEKRLHEVIDLAGSNSELAGMEAVGWYHSHTRSEIFLSEGDLEVYDRFFPEPWQIAMVLHPSDVEPVRVGFFFREEDGYVRSDQSYQEFAVDTPPRGHTTRQTPPWRVLPDGQVEEPPLAEVEPEHYELPPEPDSPSLWQRGGRWGALFIAFLAVLAGAISIYVLRMPQPAMGLEVTPVENELVIRWNPASPGLEEASNATLYIIDGRNRVEHQVLNAKNPFKTYKPLTSRVNIRLVATIGFGSKIEEVSTYLAHPDLGKPSPELRQALEAEEEAQRVVTDLERKLSDANGEYANAREQMAELERQKAELAAAKKRAQEAKRRALTASKTPTAAPKDLPDAPTVAMRQVTPSAGPPIPGPEIRVRPPSEAPKPAPIPPPSITRSAPPVPVPVPSTPAATPTTARPATAPAFGRLIWVGDWPKDGRIVIDNGKATRGFVNGDFPGVPVRVNVYPGEMGSSGLKIFTANPRQVTGKAEPGSAANGWQSTQYVLDPKAVRDVIVEQLPNAQESKKVVLRAGARRVPVVVIEWQVAQP